MKTLRLLSLLIVAALMFSCEKDVEDEVKMGEVSFGIEHIDPLDLKSDTWDVFCSEAEPVSALIKIDGDWYNPAVFYLGSDPVKLYTQAIKLPSGTYSLEEFYLLDDVYPEDLNSAIDFELINILKAAPMDDSEFKVYVNDPLPLNDYIVVPEFDKVEFTVEVLCYQPAFYTDFGFFWFNIEEIVLREIPFFGDLCHKDPGYYAETMYETVFDLDDYPFDLPALFDVVVTRQSDDKEWTFQNYDLDLNTPKEERFIAPLLVKYPDNLGQTDVFTFELLVYVPYGNNIEPVLFETWTKTDDESWDDNVNNQGVVEFVIGNCQYDPDDNVYVYIPYLNIPETVKANIQHVDDLVGYWELSLSEPDGDVDNSVTNFDLDENMIGWCGDLNTTITQGEKTMHLYNSLDETLYPIETSDGAGGIEWIDQVKYDRVNWLFNNLGNFDGFEPLSGMFIRPEDIGEDGGAILQEAIWGIVNGESTTGVAAEMVTAANAAVQNAGDFVPLPGGYAAILMWANNDPKQNQMIFTVVDP